MDNLDEPLVDFRSHAQSVTAGTQAVMKKQTEAILRQQLEKIGLSPTAEEVALHHEISRGYRLATIESVAYSENWLLKLRQANQRIGFVTDAAFLHVLGMIWFRLCLNSSPLGGWLFRRYRNSSMASGYTPDWQEYLRFMASIAFHMLRPKKKFYC